MIKMISIILLGLILCPNYYAQQKIFGYKISGNGDIVSDVFRIQDGFVLDSANVSNNNKTYKFEYDKKGRLKADFNFITSSVVKTVNGHPQFIIIPGYRDYFYNEKGDVDSIATGYWHDSLWVSDSTGISINYSYDKEGNIVSKTYLSNGVEIRDEENSYDSLGNLILNKVALSTSIDTTYNFREYDSQNRLILAKSFHSYYPQVDQNVYQYDSSGNVNCTSQSKDNGEFRNIANHYLMFDESGKLQKEIKSRIFDPTDSVWTDTLEILFSYDEYNKILSMGEETWFRYNTDGNLDTLAFLHTMGLYLEGRAILVDSYGNSLALPDYVGICTFYYSKLDSNATDIKESKLSNKTFTLYQNYPNPFNPTTTITYSLPKSSMVTLKIYDLLGREVTTLVNEEKHSGTYKVTWNAQNIPSGVYFYRLTAGAYSQVNKMILMK